MTVQEVTFNTIQEHKQSATTSPAPRRTAHPDGGCVTFQQGCHGGRGLPVRAAGRGQQQCRGQLPLPSRRTQLGDVFRQSTWAKLLPREDVETARAAGDSGIAIMMSILRETPVEEAEEHGYKEEPKLQNDMDTEAEGHGGEPSQEEQHWLENYNLDDQKRPKVIEQVEYLAG
jgi:hypothetical protein